MMIQEFFDALDEYYLAWQRLNVYDLFSERNARIEHWFKGECFSLLTSLVHQSRLPANWQSEKPYTKVGQSSDLKMDFVVTLDFPSGPKETILQFKACVLEKPEQYRDQVRYSQKAPYIKVPGVRDLAFYLKRSDEIGGDILKFQALQKRGYSILFIYPCPLESEWQQEIASFRAKMGSVAQVTEVTQRPMSLYSPNIYISKLEIIPKTSSGSLVRNQGVL